MYIIRIRELQSGVSIDAKEKRIYCGYNDIEEHPVELKMMGIMNNVYER